MTSVIKVAASVIIIFLIASCNSKLKKDVVETYEDGSPKRESFYTLAADKKEIIKEIQYYENGQKKYVGHYKKGQKDGKWTFWYINGVKQSDGYFLEGLRTGNAHVYHETGNLFYKGEYQEGQKNGTWIFYNDEGKEVNQVTFENGKIIKQTKGE